MNERLLQILVVDDESIVGTRLKPSLEKEGYKVDTFTNSELAKKRLKEHCYDIVVTDIKMAEVDGMELLRFIREEWPKTRVIMISGFATVDITRSAFQEGVVDVLSKPFKIRQLKELISRISQELQETGE